MPKTARPRRRYFLSRANKNKQRMYKNIRGSGIVPSIYRFKRKFRMADITLTGAPVAGTDGPTLTSSHAYSFNLNEVPNVGEFTALFDSYRLEKVKIWFYANTTVSNAGGAPYESNVQLVLSTDYDDAAVPANMDELFQRQNSRMKKLTSTSRTPVTHTISWPRANYGTSNAIMQSKGQWIDAGVPSTPHYGLKLVANSVSNAPPAAPVDDVVIQVYAEYTLAFKTVR